MTSQSISLFTQSMALLMENKDLLQPQVLTNPELPSLLQYIESKTVDGFDSVEGGNGPQGDPKAGKVSNATKVHSVDMPRLQSPVQTTEGHQPYSLSFSLPASPSGLHIAQARKILICDQSGPTATDVQPNGPSESSAVDPQQPKQAKFHSQPIAAVNSYSKAAAGGKVPDPVENQGWVPANDVMRDARFDPFKTWSGGLERQLSNLRGRPQPGPDVEANGTQISEIEALPAVERYFDALEGPELDTLRASEVSVLPEDEKWPFLLRFPISSFGMCLGVSSQAILWKKLATSPSTSFLHVSPNVNLVLWCISLALMGIVSLIYSLKIIFFFEAVRREYYHPVRVNFFFAPWIACLFLVLGVPPSIAERQPAALWYVLMAPIFCLDLKIYGQWMSGGRRRLSKVANPSNHLAIVGNFVGALLGASMGLKEGPIFFFAVGLAHYTVLFVTLYQRLPTTTTLPKELHPVFFLFVATPSVACMAWAQIRSDFDYGARIVYFIALFLYLSLAVRVNFFRGFRFSLAWWAYTFPTTGASVATIRYADEVTSAFSRSLAVSLSAISTFAVGTLLVTTIIHAFVLRDLFPNDVSIAITQKRPKFSRKLARLISPGSSDLKDREASIGRDSPSP